MFYTWLIAGFLFILLYLYVAVQKSLYISLDWYKFIFINISDRKSNHFWKYNYPKLSLASWPVSWWLFIVLQLIIKLSEELSAVNSNKTTFILTHPHSHSPENTPCHKQKRGRHRKNGLEKEIYITLSKENAALEVKSPHSSTFTLISTRALTYIPYAILLSNIDNVFSIPLFHHNI